MYAIVSRCEAFFQSVGKELGKAKSPTQSVDAEHAERSGRNPIFEFLE
jgi:hypothetical protein